MAGGIVIMFRMQDEEPYTEMGLASGIHGGEIFIRGSVEEWTLGIGSSARPATSEDIDRIKSFIFEFSQYYGIDPAKLMNSSYTRIAPVSARPFAGK